MNKNPLKKLLGQKVPWRMGKDDDWKVATVMDENAYLIYPLGEPETENTFYCQYAKAILQSAMIEYLDCMADDGRRFRAYCVLNAMICPLERSKKPRWENPASVIQDFPLMIAGEHAYLINQVLPADDKSDFSPEQPDLKPLLSMLALPEA